MTTCLCTGVAAGRGLHKLAALSRAGVCRHVRAVFRIRCWHLTRYARSWPYASATACTSSALSTA